MFRSSIDRGPDGEIRVRLGDEERALLHDVAEELRELLGDGRGNPSLRRLFPPAHEDDEDLEREYRELTATHLEQGRVRAVETLRDTSARETLSQEEADAWLRALNDARLVLGTRLDIAEDFDWDTFDARHPRAAELALYAYLSGVQEQLVEVL